MKKLLIAFQLMAVSAGAQIALENTYPSSTGANDFGLVNLSSSGYKYYKNTAGTITLYNLNHTVYRSFSIPSQPFTPMTNIGVRFMSEELFNSNAGDIEYLLVYHDTLNFGLAARHVRVYDELGNLLFSRDSVDFMNSTNSVIAPSNGIVYTDQGVKMILFKGGINAEVEVYSLPGSLPCNECTGGVISGLSPTTPGDNTQQHQLPNPYPNPTNSTTTIPYELPAGINTGQLIVYDLLGQEVKRYSVTSAFSTIEIAAGELALGTYSYSLQTSAGITKGHQFVLME